MLVKRLLAFGIILTLLASPVASASAAVDSTSATPKGLLVTPVRNELKVDAGGHADASIVVANLTSQPIVVNLKVKNFSVQDLTYDYRFSDPTKPWIHLEQTQLQLAVGQSKTIPYALTPDQQATPGGYYYSIIASTTTSEGGLPSTLQAASLLYITINGKLVQTGEIKDILAPKFVFSKQFDVSIDARNTGNVYYFASISGSVRGLFARPAQAAPSHLLIPDKTRRVSGVIQSPPLPGVYPVEVSYKTDTGTAVRASQYVLFIPPWSIAALLGLLLIGKVLYKRRRPTSVSDVEQDRS